MLRLWPGQGGAAGGAVSRIYRYDKELGEVVEISTDWSDTERRAPVPSEEATYGNLTATDGTLLNSRAKHREYMKAHGLALAGDFQQTWAKAKQQREDFFAGKRPMPGLKEAIGRAVDQVRGRKR